MIVHTEKFEARIAAAMARSTVTPDDRIVMTPPETDSPFEELKGNLELITALDWKLGDLDDDDPTVPRLRALLAMAIEVVRSLRENGRQLNLQQQEAIQQAAYRDYLPRPVMMPNRPRILPRSRSSRAPRRSGVVRRLASSSSSPPGSPESEPSPGSDDPGLADTSEIIVGERCLWAALKAQRNIVAALQADDLEEARDHALGLVYVAQHLVAILTDRCPWPMDPDEEPDS